MARGKKVLEKKSEGDLSVLIMADSFSWKGKLGEHFYGNEVFFEEGQGRTMADVWPKALHIWEKSREALIKSHGLSLR